MTVIDHINNADKTILTFELLPPLKGTNIDCIYRTINELMDFNPPFINITYHREEVVYKKHKTGLLERKTVHKRPGTVAIAAAVKFKYQLDVVPHIICGGFSKEETENALIDLHFLGIHNVLALRGDSLKSDRRFVPDEDGHAHALSLVQQIKTMNKGIYLDDELLNTTATNFCVGVAGYPEKHVEAPNLAADLRFLKKKVEAGADFIVTQMFFDNQKFYNFVDLCRKEGITVPIIPGLKPIATMSQINVLPQTFNIDLPEDLMKELDKCCTNEQVKQVGIEWGIYQSQELVKFGSPIIHYYTMGNADNIKKIAKAVF